MESHRSDGGGSGERYAVAVVGGGPAGSTCARRLSEEGFSVALLDENPRPRREVVCTGIVGEEAFERFPLPTEAVVDVIRAARFLSPDGVPVDYEPDGLMARVVDRTTFDGRLAERAREAGADLLRGWSARGVERHGTGVRVRAETESGGAALDARVLVVATGHQRWLHEEAGLGVPGDYVHGVHADVPFRGPDVAELFFGRDVAPGYFGWAVPFGDRARLGLLAPQYGRKHFERLLELPRVRERVAWEGALENWRPKALRRLRSRGIVQGRVRPSYSDRVLAVGEAAGQVKTTTAGGIYFGMIGAEIAADVLAERLPVDALSGEELAAYGTRWWDRLGPEIEAGRKLQELGRGMSDRQIDELFGALNEGLGATVRRVVRFDWHRPALETILRSGTLRSLVAA